MNKALSNLLLFLEQKMFRYRLPSLNCVVAAIALASTPASAQQAEILEIPQLAVGAEVDLSSLHKAVWIKGEAPKSFEQGKVYIIECWATWCSPCIAMIPHLNELHKKYYDKGLRVYGMSVWEDDQQKTRDFVTKKGDGMAYPVAFTGNGSSFEKKWLDAAKAKSIPHAFIVRNGKLLASTQASRLTDSLIESLLSGDEGARKASGIISTSQTNQAKTDKLVDEISAARRVKNSKTMATKLKELKAIDPDHPDTPMLELWLLIVREDWPAALTALNEMPASEAKRSFISRTGRIASSNSPYPEDFEKALIKLYSDFVLLSESQIGPNHFANLSIIQWRMGDRENALITANKSVEAAKKMSRGAEAYTVAFTRFAKSVNEGHMPEVADLSKWIREALKEVQSTK